MGQTTVQPEHKPEQREEPEGNGGFNGLAWVLACLGGILRFRGQKHAIDRLVQRDTPYPERTV